MNSMAVSASSFLSWCLDNVYSAPSSEPVTWWVNVRRQRNSWIQLIESMGSLENRAEMSRSQRRWVKWTSHPTRVAVRRSCPPPRPVAGHPRAPAGSPWALVPPLLPVTPKMVPEHQLAKPLCPCPRQQGLARAGVWSLWLPCWEEVPGRQKISKTNIPEISMDEKFSVNDSQWFSFVSFVFLFHLDGNFVVFLLRKREPWLTYYTADFIHFDSYITSLSLLFSRKWWVHESPETPTLCSNWRNTISSYLQNDRLAIIYECSLLGKQFCKDHLER